MTSKPKTNLKNMQVWRLSFRRLILPHQISGFFQMEPSPICRECLSELVGTEQWWSMDKFCQWADYPFLPDVWTKLKAELEDDALTAYIKRGILPMPNTLSLTGRLPTTNGPNCSKPEHTKTVFPKFLRQPLPT